MEKNKEVYKNIKKYFTIDDTSDLYIQWCFDTYAALRTEQFLPLFNRAYDVMSERGNFSRKKAFGEMHGDNYMWVEKSNNAKVIVLETQSNLFIYILKNSKFHIRELYTKNIYPEYLKYKLKNCKLENFIKNDFDDSYESLNPALTYADGRDEGYIGTAYLFLEGFKKVDGANSKYLYVLGLIGYWEIYLDNPDELE